MKSFGPNDHYAVVDGASRLVAKPAYADANVSSPGLNDNQGIAFLSNDGPTSTYSMPERTSYDMASVDRLSAFSYVSH